MSEPHNSQPDPPDDRQHERLESYLDGLLMSAERQAFEQELVGSESLRRECELQRDIDASLARTFAAPAPPENILALAEKDVLGDAAKQLPNRDQVDPSKRRRTILAVLAVCVAWIVVGWKLYVGSTDDGYRQVALADIYTKCVADGFRPKWVCEDDREFAETFQRRQGLPLLLKPAAKDTMVGLSYLRGITRQTTTMLARVDGEPILVFVDRRDNDTHPSEPSWWSGLHLFRQELDELVLYEITPYAEPRVMEHFFVPEPGDLPVEATNPTNEEENESP